MKTVDLGTGEHVTWNSSHVSKLIFYSNCRIQTLEASEAIFRLV